MRMAGATRDDVCSTPMPKPCTSVRVNPSSGAPLPMFLRVNCENGSSMNFQPLKSSANRTE